MSASSRVCTGGRGGVKGCKEEGVGCAEEITIGRAGGGDIGIGIWCS